MTYTVRLAGGALGPAEGIFVPYPTPTKDGRRDPPTRAVRRTCSVAFADPERDAG